MLPEKLNFHRDAFVLSTPRLTKEEADSVVAAIQDCLSQNTRKAYRSDWKLFAAWCTGRGVDPLPAAPELVACYLTELATSLKVSTIGRRLTAIGQAHLAAQEANPADHILVRSTYKGIRRQLKKIPTNQKQALTTATLLSVLPLPDSPRHKRDCALLLIGFAAALRRSEVVSLDWSDIAEVEEGLVITLGSSKTDQEGQGRKIAIPESENPARCPVRSLLVWREEYRSWRSKTGSPMGPVFVRIDHTGIKGARLSSHAVARIVKKYVARAGLKPENFSGHSMRAGFATSAAAGGAEERAIMRQTGHRSVTTVRKYIREGELFRKNPLKDTGL